MRCRWNKRTGKELIGWGRNREQGRANKTDAEQVWREKQAGENKKKHKRQ